MNRVYRAFVSSTYADLKDHRAFVINELRGAGIFVDPMENWQADADEPREFSLRRLTHCDLCVLLVAFRRGFIPTGESESITQLEYRHAIANDIPVLVFVLDPDAPWPRRFDETVTDPAVATWRQSLRERHGAPYFNLKPESIQIATAIARWIADHHENHQTQSGPTVSIEHLPVTGGGIVGREDILQQLDEIWGTKQANVVCLVGPAGAGKTSIVNEWLNNLAIDDYRGAHRVFAWSFGSKEADQREVSASDFAAEALQFFDEREPPTTPAEQGRRLAQVVSAKPSILVLDGLEALQQSREPNELKDSTVQTLVRKLAAQNRGLCVLSSLIEVSELRAAVGKMVKVIRVEGLSTQAGTDLLKNLGVTGPDREFERAVYEHGGLPLSLTFLGAALLRFQNGDIRRRDELTLEGLADAGGADVIERWLGQGPELDILRVLGLFNRPADSGAIDALRSQPIEHLSEHLATLTKQGWNSALKVLRDLRLVSAARETGRDLGLDTNTIIRQQFATQLKSRYPDSWREANGRLFEFYRDRAPRLPDSIEDMTDLFRAVVHGCRAGRHQEVFDTVYWPRIRRGDLGYSVVQLNAWSTDLVAVSHFFADGDFERPLGVLDALSSARVCTEAAFDLRGHGRIDEAIGAAVIGLRRLEELAHWPAYCEGAGNLSELRTLHAELAEADKIATRSIERFPDERQAAFDDDARAYAMGTLSANLATRANVLLQRGELEHAEQQFMEAERAYRESQTDHQYLRRLPGYLFADLLLALGRLDEVEARAQAALVNEKREYAIGLAHLAMARRLTLLSKRDTSLRGQAQELMTEACSQLRQAGATEMKLRGLLASAELHRQHGQASLARVELGEVLEEAARVHMKLFEADAHLQLAHIEAVEQNPRAARVQLDHCRGVMQAFGYHRIRQEIKTLEDSLATGPRVSVTTAGDLSVAARAASARQAFEQAQRQFTEVFLRLQPVDGTQLGLPGKHDSRLPTADLRERADLFSDLTASAHALRAASELSRDPEDLVDGELAVAGVRGMRIVEDALRPYSRNPGVYVDGVVRGVYAIMARTDLTTGDKVEALASRLRAVPDYLASGQDQVSRSPQVLVDNAVGDAEGAAQFFERDVHGFVKTLSLNRATTELGAAVDIARTAVDHFREFVATLSDTATKEFALGRFAFDALLHDVHQLHQDAAELDELGQAVTADLESDLARASLKSVGHPRWWETGSALQEVFPTSETLLDDYRRLLGDARTFVERHELIKLERVGSLEVVATPPFARANLPFAAYVGAPPFASSGRGEFWVTPPGDSLSPDEQLAVLRRHYRGRMLVACVHEAYPGHHVQFDRALHVKRPVRHFFASTVFMEGWALYCEDLMRREGFLLDGPDGPALEVSMLRDQLWRALRVIIDVRLHCKGMTRDEAVSLLVQKHVLDQPSAEAEVMYYCSAPTQPMSYMVGRLLMEGLIKKRSGVRREVQKSLSDVRDEVLARGALPFPLLERLLRGQDQK